MARRKPAKGNPKSKKIAASLLKCELAWADVPAKLARELIKGI